jgi:hypothetical protein
VKRLMSVSSLGGKEGSRMDGLEELVLRVEGSLNEVGGQGRCRQGQFDSGRQSTTH